MKEARKIPKFKSEEEEFEFWSTHSIAYLMRTGERVEIDFSEARRRRDERRAKQSAQHNTQDTPPGK